MLLALQWLRKAWPQLTDSTNTSSYVGKTTVVPSLNRKIYEYLSRSLNPSKTLALHNLKKVLLVKSRFTRWFSPFRPCTPQNEAQSNELRATSRKAHKELSKLTSKTVLKESKKMSLAGQKMTTLQQVLKTKDTRNPNRTKLWNLLKPIRQQITPFFSGPMPQNSEATISCHTTR